MIDLETVLLRRSDVVYRHVPPETVVIRQGGPEVMVLSSVAGRILDMIDGRASLRAVTLLLGKEYDAPPETLEQDVVAFAEELLAADVVSVVSVISSASPGIDHA